MNKKPDPKPLTLKWWITVRKEYKSAAYHYLCTSSIIFAEAWGKESQQRRIKSLANKLMPAERKLTIDKDLLFPIMNGTASRLKFLNLVIKQLKSEKN